MDFFQQMISKAKSCKKRIVLPEIQDIRILKAAEMITAQSIAEVVLIGNEASLKSDHPDLQLEKVVFLDPLESDKTESYVEPLVQLRKHKGIDQDQARTLLRDPLYFGMMMVHQEDADGLVAGAIHSTADVLRPALQILKCAPGVRLVSSCFLMVLGQADFGENGAFIFSDCALVEAPDSQQLSDIAIAAAQSCRALIGTTPKVAMLSYSTKGSAQSAMTEKVKSALSLTREKYPELIVDGEMQLDAAIVPSVSQLKCPDSPLKGQANTLIFPDLNSANIGYKLVQRLANAKAFGPITQGLSKPVNDLSRGCSAEDVVGVVAITAVQSQNS